MTHPPRLLAGAAWLFLATACAGAPTPTAVLPPGIAGHPEVFLNRLLADETAVATVRGLASVRYEGPGGAGSANQVIVVALPDRARLEALSPIGTAMLILAIRGDELTAYAPAQHEYGVGRATRETLGKLVRVSVPPGPLLRLLVGLPPLQIRSDDPRVGVVEESAAIRVESVDGPLWQRLWTGPDGESLERGELGDAAGPLLRFQFGERRRLDGVAFPFVLRIEELTLGTRVALRYETVRLNEAVETTLFEVPRPVDGRTRFFDLGGGFPPP